MHPLSQLTTFLENYKSFATTSKRLILDFARTISRGRNESHRDISNGFLYFSYYCAQYNSISQILNSSHEEKAGYSDIFWTYLSTFLVNILVNESSLGYFGVFRGSLIYLMFNAGISTTQKKCVI